MKRRKLMPKELTKQEAADLLGQYNKDPFHIRHAYIVAGVMRYFAEALGYGDEADL
jgi:predicted hydrolase (HD superfamily)